MRVAQDIEVGAKLVEHDQVVVALRLQAGDQVLADQTCAAGNHDTGFFHAFVAN
jgi:hypothetical protein